MTQTDGEVYLVLNWKNQYCENDYIIQSNLQIQCNPYQITNGARTENFTICMKTQKTPNSHRNLEKKKMELKESGFLTSEYTTKLQ